MEYALEIKNVCKNYGSFRALDKVSLTIPQGAIYGLIGKNGAGKSTIMKIITGNITYDEGQIRIFDSDDLSANRRMVGSLIEEPGLYYGKTAYENMKLFSLLYDDVTDDDITEILKQVGLDNTGKKKVKGFSLGMRQRLGIAIALMGRPQLLVLDEPINGLDPAGIKEIRDMILKLNSTGVTFMISSHLLDELGKVVTRYGIMADGELIEEISSDDLKERCRKHVAVTVDDVKETQNILSQAMADVEIKEGEDENTIFIMSDIADTSQISSILVNKGIKLYALIQQGITLEDYFIEKLGGVK